MEFILDLTGYRSERPLHAIKLLEPSFGNGDFSIPAIDRLLRSWKASDKTSTPLESLGGCIRAVELHRDTFDRTHAELIALLVGAGIAARVSEAIVDRWLVHGDFLLAELPNSFDVVIGNPPYVRRDHSQRFAR